MRFGQARQSLALVYPQMALMKKIAAVQMRVALGDCESNLRRIASFLEATAAQGARLTVFPECALTGYCFRGLDEARPYAQPIPGSSTGQMAAVCRRLGTWAVCGLLELEGDRVYNSCVLIGPQGLAASYRKIHLPFLGVDRFTTHGNRPFAIHDADGIRVGMNICYDGAFPESARIMALQGADLVVLPTNWPEGLDCVANCVPAARAMENHIFYLAVNRVGVERGVRFIGMSRICAPGGRVVAEAMHDREAVLYADLDVDLARNKHVVRTPGENEINRIKDRRPEMYGLIAANGELQAVR